MRARLRRWWREVRPQRENGMGLVLQSDFPDPGGMVPILITQIVGGDRWAVCLVRTRPVVPRPDKAAHCQRHETQQSDCAACQSLAAFVRAAASRKA